MSEINKIKKDLDDLMKRLELEAEQQRLKNNTANITRDKIKFMASEIVRGMTNAKLNEEQQKMLLYVSNCVLCNHLIYKNENKRRNLIFNKSNIGVKEISRESIKKNLSNLLYLAKQAVKNKGKND